MAIIKIEMDEIDNVKTVRRGGGRPVLELTSQLTKPQLETLFYNIWEWIEDVGMTELLKSEGKKLVDITDK